MRNVLTYSTVNHSFGWVGTSELIISKEPKGNDNKTCSGMNTICEISYIFHHENLGHASLFKEKTIK